MMAISAAAIAMVDAAILRQRRTCVDNWMTLELSAEAAGATAAERANCGVSGSTSGSCGPDSPAAVLILSQTSGRGSTDPTIWFRTPSRYCQACTSAVKSLSTDISDST